MNLEIYRTDFLEVDKISSIKSHIEKIKYQQVDSIIKCEMDIDMTYRDIEFNECFISIPYKFELDIDAELEVFDIKINKIFVYVIEAKGISIEYELVLVYNDKSKKIEIIDEIDEKELLDDNVCENVKIVEEIKEENINDLTNDITDENIKTEEEISEEIKENQEKELEEKKGDNDIQEKIDKVKEEIEKDYEAKLASNLATREDSNIRIISTLNKKNEIDFLKFFDSKEEKYRVKTLICESEEELNDISKKYKISINDLLDGYDKNSKRVIFKINSSSSN